MPKGCRCSIQGHSRLRPTQFCKKIGSIRGLAVSRALEIKGHAYWILSEPYGEGWKAKVVELCEEGATEELGIDASAETRGAADDAAERKLRRLLQVC